MAHYDFDSALLYGHSVPHPRPCNIHGVYGATYAGKYGNSERSLGKGAGSLENRRLDVPSGLSLNTHLPTANDLGEGV